MKQKLAVLTSAETKLPIISTTIANMQHQQQQPQPQSQLPQQQYNHSNLSDGIISNVIVFKISGNDKIMNLFQFQFLESSVAS